MGKSLVSCFFLRHSVYAGGILCCTGKTIGINMYWLADSGNGSAYLACVCACVRLCVTLL